MKGLILALFLISIMNNSFADDKNYYIDNKHPSFKYQGNPNLKVDNQHNKVTTIANHKKDKAEEETFVYTPGDGDDTFFHEAVVF